MNGRMWNADNCTWPGWCRKTAPARASVAALVVMIVGCTTIPDADTATRDELETSRSASAVEVPSDSSRTEASLTALNFRGPKLERLTRRQPETRRPKAPSFEGLTDVGSLPNVGRITLASLGSHPGSSHFGTPTFALTSFESEPAETAAEGATQDEEEEDPFEGEMSAEEMAERINNPLGNLWMISMQYDIGQWEGDIVRAGDRKTNSTFYLQPVLPFKLTEDWSVIARPTFPISSFTAPSGFDVVEGEEEPGFVPGSFDRETGLGDTIFPLWFSARTKPPFVIGAGPTFMFPTASDEILGTEKWSAGPSAMAMYIGEEWIMGFIMQHWWDYASKSGSRDQVNLTNFQLMYRYRVTPTFNVSGSPNIVYNWDTDEATIPLGIGVDKIIKIGPAPLKIGAEFQYFPAKPDAYGPEWQIRIIFTPIIPIPAFAKTPLFGG